MNKQQLASKIWDSANKMRSKIEANEYKDYILGFMFYKFLSDKELSFLEANDFAQSDIEALTEEDAETVEFIKNGIGYFIAHDDLFSTWLNKGLDFTVADVRDALSAFSRHIHSSHKKVFDGIFKTLETGLSKLGDNSNSQTKAISDLLQLIKVIPMNSKQDYDVLGFIYEYLIGSFAANAGKKAGEFYTPHEVSVLMSEIIAHHLKDQPEIKIYDPTSGSGSLLINIGSSVAKHVNDANKIKYYAQELKENTYNLTRMNLVMRGILPANIVARNADTLEDDWPFFEDNDPINTYEPLYVDAVVSNPPYSQAWDPANKDADPRYKEFGLAPKTKADYAFLLHDLYHLKPKGIMAIVLPHGVLFRGGEEERIRTNLIKKNHIDAIIGLPANIFFGTGIPTVIIILKQQRPTTDVLIVDASKGFVKLGKNNHLQASNIKKIVDTVIERKDVEQFSRLVTQKEIQDQGYNLNIPRYVDSSATAETWDIYATMFGGIPKKEIDAHAAYWAAFPQLRQDLFTKSDTPYVNLAVTEISQAIQGHQDVKGFVGQFNTAFADFKDYLKGELIGKMQSLHIAQQEDVLSKDIFKRLADIPLVDKYQAYQALDDQWQGIAGDLEIIQSEGLNAAKIVNPNIVIKKKDGKEHEVQEGWLGYVLPFDLVQQRLLSKELEALKAKERELAEASAEIESLMESLSEEDKEQLLNEANDAFVPAEIAKALKQAYAEIETPEIVALNEYLEFLGTDPKPKKPQKEQFVKDHTEVQWSNIEANKDGTYAAPKVKAYLKQLRSGFSFEEGSLEATLVQVDELLAQEKELKAQISKDEAVLHLLTKTTIEALEEAQVKALLEAKWVEPIVSAILALPNEVIEHLTDTVQALADKYAVTYTETTQKLTEAEHSLADLIDDLTGDEFDMQGLAQFQALLKGV
ncbi:type I restriction-modification system subunit M [Acinetobacter lwoffii]|uniref:site-specific DNA-methyltransferase (adenine-specific) n=1 Tax=Acinetobacter lwoffii NCTC 5866 = CIP 64.10 = NIPH 512 TaxID=981327 RepID=A0ABN0PXX8_ACILW|nr:MULTISPECIES: type I restriction-modification system subunit M [Acinetobacter]ENU15990.1 type I restriction-modification system, M subunit [Acinetobacter sp. CIP A162]ESJ95351.1 type I restriction-modification system, M subunit [Acinetobacter lwoffii NCTC 5866 = CIP 64.10 = NIPH 512]QXB41073.1 type I restriction-modification system subunit M [Acinetobacter lwoffii]SUU32633.1 type I site-specific deoxyribonuclease [Acinetobacter lwoffii]VFQ37091.1 type I site-specific deoxyribonuclease [Acin